MATRGTYAILPLTVKIDKTPKGKTSAYFIRNVCDKISENLKLLDAFLRTEHTLSAVNINQIYHCRERNTHVLDLDVHCVDECDKLYAIAQKPQSKTQNVLSQKIQEFFEKSLRDQCNVPSTTNVTFSIVWKREDYEISIAYFQKEAPSISRCDLQLRPSIAETQSHVDYKKKKFILYVPGVVQSVKIVSESIRELNTHLIQGPKPYIFYKDVSIPSNTEGVFWYEITEKKTTFIGIVWSENTYKTDIFSVSNTCTQRDCIEQENDDFISAHLENIFYDSPTTMYAFEECCKQIEYICRRTCRNVENVVKCLTVNFTILAKDMHELFAFGLALLKPKEYVLRKYLMCMGASSLVESLMNTSLTKFPSDCFDLLIAISTSLSKVALEDKFTWSKFMNIFFTFFGEDILLELLKRNVPLPYSLVGNDCKDVEDIVDKCKSSSNPNALHLVGKCLLLIPLTMGLRIYEKHRYWMLTHKEMTEAIRCKFLQNLHIKVNEKDIDGICCLAKILDELTDSSEFNLLEVFEKAISDCLEKNVQIPSSFEMQFIDFLKKTKYFGSIEMQTRLLTAIAESLTTNVRKLLIHICKAGIYEDALSELPTRCLISWLQNSVKYAGKDKVLSIFQYMRDLIRSPPFSNRQDVQNALKDKLAYEMKVKPLKELLRSVQEVEDICENEPEMAAVFREQVLETMEKKAQRPTEVLRCMCFGNTLRINTGLTAQLVCTTIELYFRQYMHDDAFSTFMNQIQNAEFWELVTDSCGTKASIVKEHSIYKEMMTQLINAVEVIQSNDVTMEIIVKLNLQDGNTKKLLFLCGFKDKDLKRLNKILDDYHKLKVQVCQVEKVVRKVRSMQEKIPMHLLEDDMLGNEAVTHIISAGKVTAKDIFQENVWKAFEDLPSVCSHLHGIIKSTVFWNVSLLEVNARCIEIISEHMSDDPLNSIRHLFNEDFCTFATNQLFTYLMMMRDRGIRLYSNAWNELDQNSATIRISDVIDMFQDADVLDEIEHVESFLHLRVKHGVKETLQRLWKLDDIKDRVDTIAVLLSSFGFKTLQSGQFITETFLSIQKNLDTVYEITAMFSEEAVSIMDVLGRSTNLVTFLRDIELEDVRNLIDAVEDISESHVQESTVSALIDAKTFIVPLLNDTLKSCKSFLETVQRQIDYLGKNAKLFPGKLGDCNENLHNLNSLYNNVANRSEQTKEIIKNVITKGKFLFELDKSNIKATVTVFYKDNGITINKSESTLSDIRSRAHLLLNTERQTSEGCNPDEFKGYINLVDASFEVKDILQELYSSGHTEYMNFKLKFRAQCLHSEKDILEDRLFQWMHELKFVRNEYYLMNFVRGCQIHALFEFLKNRVGEDDVNTILAFIHNKLSAKGLLEWYLYNQEHAVGISSLQVIGKSLHDLYFAEDINIVQRPMQSEWQTSKSISDVVLEGNILLTHLEENSEYVVRTVLALFLNTLNALPAPYQLLLCTNETPISEIELFFARCKGSSEFFRTPSLYCVANVEMLPNEVQFQLLDCLDILSDCTRYRLALVCRGSKNHPFVERLSDNLVTVHPLSDQTIVELFHQLYPFVWTYTSEIPGLGKSTEIAKQAHRNKRCAVKHHISGKVNRSDLIKMLYSAETKDYHVLHLDIGNVDDSHELDSFLFELILLRYVESGQIAFCLPTDHICIEIANTINNTLRNSLPTATAFQRVHLEWRDFKDFTISREILSPTQVVCHYLHALESNALDEKDIKLFGPQSVTSLKTEMCRSLLRKYTQSASDISHTMVHIFINVLADQLKKFSSSTYFKVKHISLMIGEDEYPTVRSSLIKAMVDVSLEFALRSVDACRSTQEATLSKGDSDSTTDTSLASKLVQRTDTLIRWEESNHLFYIFHRHDIQTLTPVYRDQSQVPSHIRKVFEHQLQRSLTDFKTLTQRELQMVLQRAARNQQNLLSDAQLEVLRSTYALTPDNLLKMILIIMRIVSSVPVIVMGETGCGKTSLIRYLASICEVPFRVLNVHAGVDSTNVLQTVEKENELCLCDPTNQHWLFLDEINTSECLGLIADIMCHRNCNGNVLAPNLIIMGACNPYKLRSKESIQTAGLAGKIKTDELSKLVYRVLPLPEMMVDYVWDFGSLSKEDEMKYIERMAEGAFQNSKLHILFCKLLCTSQAFVREKERTTCVVSLRDVSRCKTLVCWFKDILKTKHLLNTSRHTCDSDIKAIILALSHCYQSRFVDKGTRQLYRKRLEDVFTNENCGPLSERYIFEIIKEEQRDIINRMQLPMGTAKNVALQENVFMILVCILNRIPIFVVGKPGCSKSLAMQVIRSNLRGKDSKDKFFKTLPQLYCVSFQGSESSTSDGIMKVFEKAESYQKSNANDVLSVVILDEIGLAEISRFNPLKVLHSLLEPDGMSTPNVAVVGISNWSLDASKMNRGIHLSRPDMDEDELFETAISISQSFNTSTQMRLGKKGLTGATVKSAFRSEYIEADLKNIALAYTEYTRNLQFQNFHGLRDFYALVKYIARRLICEVDTVTPDKKALAIVGGLQRNFGGLKDEEQNLKQKFDIYFTDTPHGIKVNELIKENVNDELARHLMIITRGDSVFGIVEQTLIEAGRSRREVIYGSQFDEDLTDDYHYRILSRIILCMEEGIVLILKDLDSIYGSLYDMLNQNYTRIGKKDNCRIALGPYSNPFCHVAETFRCIVLVEENKIDFADPPFLNRFEKHYLSFGDLMTEKQHDLVRRITHWIECVSKIQNATFTTHDIFPFFNDELVISLVIWASKQPNVSDESIIDVCKSELMWLFNPGGILRLQNAEDFNTRSSSETVRGEYFRLPLHYGLHHLIISDIERSQDAEQPYKCTVIFTNSSLHTKYSEQLDDLQYQSEYVCSFKSEKQLSSKLQSFWKSAEKNVLVVHCHTAEDEKHVMLTKSLIEKYRSEQEDGDGISCKKYVYLILHMAASSGQSTISTGAISQINFLSGWKLVMLECLEILSTPLPVLTSMTLLKAIESMMPISSYIKDEIFWAFTRIKYAQQGRDIETITQSISVIEESQEFLDEIAEYIWNKITTEIKDEENFDWCNHVACDMNALNKCMYLSEALYRHVTTRIRIPLAKILYQLENYCNLDSFFVGDEHKMERQLYWKAQFRDNRYFNIEGIKNESGPECYSCSAADLRLKVPFGRHIFNMIESTKDSFLDDLALLKAGCDSGTDELPEAAIAELMRQHRDVVANILPDLGPGNAAYRAFLMDYVDDFCNITSYSFCSKLDRGMRINTTKWVLAQKFSNQTTYEVPYLEVLTNLHCISWIHSTLLSSVVQLIDLCCDAFESDDELVLFLTVKNQFHLIPHESERNHNENHEIEASYHGIEDENMAEEEKDDDESHITESEISEEEIEDGFAKLVSLVCFKMLPTKENLTAFKTVENWQFVTRNALLCASNVSFVSSTYHSLRLCYDLVTYLVAPYGLNKSVMFDVASCLQENEVYSEEAGRECVKLFATLQGSSYNLPIQRTVRQYLLSSMAVCQVESEVFTILFSMIEKSQIPDQEILVLKRPIQHGLKEALDDYQEEREDNRKSLDDLFALDNTTESDESSGFLYSLRNCLSSMFIQNRQNCEFVYLIQDLLEEIFSEYYENEIGDRLMVSCSKGITKNCTGLSLLSSIAYLRVCISHITMRMITEGKCESHTYGQLNAVFAGLTESNYRTPVFVYLLKQIENIAGMKLVFKHADQMNDNMIEIRDMKLQDEYISYSLEENPLSVFMNPESLAEARRCIPMDGSTEKIQKSVNELFQKVNGLPKTEGKLVLFSFVMNQFYLPTYRNMMTDTDRTCAALLKYKFKPCLNTQQMQAIDCLLGIANFTGNMFKAGEEIPYSEFALSSVILSTIAVTLSTECTGKHLPVMQMCLLCPNDTVAKFLPGFKYASSMEFDSFKTNIMNEKISRLCACGYFLMFPNDINSACCVFCKTEHDTSQSALLPSVEEKQSPKPGFTVSSLPTPKDIMLVEDLSPLTPYVLQFLVAGNMLGSVALQFTKTSDIQSYLDIGSEEPSKLLWEHLLKLWSEIRKMLNSNDFSTLVFLLEVIKDSRYWLFDSCVSYKTTLGRDTLEKEVNEVIVKCHTNLCDVIAKNVRNCDSVFSLPSSSLELQIREADMSNPLQDYLMFFRTTTKPTQLDFFLSTLEQPIKIPFFVQNNATYKQITSSKTYICNTSVAFVDGNYSEHYSKKQ